MFSPTSLKLTLATGLCLLVAAASAQQVYSWKDKNGRTHYSDAPPADSQAQPVRSVASPPPLLNSDNGSPGAQPKKSLAEKEADFRLRKAEKEAKEEKERQEQANKEKLAQHCAEQRKYLKAYEHGPISKPNDKGGWDYLSDAERNKYLQEMRERIKNECPNS